MTLIHERSSGENLHLNLGICSGSIYIFGIIVACMSTADEANLFVATVGYAAFLAVFMGVASEKQKHDEGR